jgi:hypothetical protein
MKIFMRCAALGATVVAVACSSLAAQQPTQTGRSGASSRASAAYDDYYHGFYEGERGGQTPTSIRIADESAQPTPAPSAAAASSGSCGGCGSCDSCCAADACGSGCCEESCDSCCDPCCWMHKFFVFGEPLVLRARNTEVAYAVPVNGPIVPLVPNTQIGAVGVVDQEYDFGFRLGGGWMCSDLSSITLQYTLFESSEIDAIDANAPFVLESLVHHPLTASAVTPWLNANARHDIDMNLIDVDYRHIFRIGNGYALNWLAGFRYASLEQTFVANFANLGVSQVFSNVQFDGAGIRVGIEGERVGRRGFMAYGKGHASFVGGEFSANYRQRDVFNLNEVVTSWEGARLVSILDLEVGAGWYSQNGRWRLSAGYLVSGWFNTVKTDDWVQAVRNNNFVDMNDGISFDGFVGRVEYRF